MIVRLLGVVALIAFTALVPAHAQRGHFASGQTLGTLSLPKMVDAYQQNGVRFKRDYAGKHFEDIMQFRSAKESADRYLVGFGLRGFTSDVDCSVSDKAEIDRIVDWNKGDRIWVRGVRRWRRL